MPVRGGTGPVGGGGACTTHLTKTCAFHTACQRLQSVSVRRLMLGLALAQAAVSVRRARLGSGLDI